MRIDLREGLGFSGAHFIVGHQRCEHLHGHNWKVGVTVEGEPDERGLVVDFLELKRMVREMCEAYDHRVLLPSMNSALTVISRTGSVRISVHGRVFEFPEGDVVWIPAVNTTVEELARVISEEVAKGLSGYANVRKITVVVEESPGESATQEKTLR
ncbi:MAG: 6-carboxytetrahydropterin synthase [Candidatus Hadarchaeales archaeon]